MPKKKAAAKKKKGKEIDNKSSRKKPVIKKKPSPVSVFPRSESPITKKSSRRKKPAAKKKISPQKKPSPPPRSPIRKSPLKELSIIKTSPKKESKSPDIASPKIKKVDKNTSKRCSIPSPRQLEDAVISILEENDYIRLNIVYQTISDSPSIYKSQIKSKFKQYKDKSVIIIETIRIVLNVDGYYDFDSSISASLALIPSIIYKLKSSSSSNLTEYRVRLKLEEKLVLASYTDFYVLQRAIEQDNRCNNKDIIDKLQIIIQEVVRSTTTMSEYRNALEISKGSNKVNIPDEDTFNSLLRLSNSLLVEDFVPNSADFVSLRNKYNILLQKEPIKTSKKSKSKSPIKQLKTCNIEITSNEIIDTLLSLNKESISYKKGNIYTWIRAHTSKNGYNETNILFKHNKNKYSYSISPLLISYDTFHVQEFATEEDNNLNKKELISVLQSVYEKVEFVDLYLYYQILMNRNNNCIREDTVIEYISKVLINSGISIQTVNSLLYNSKSPSNYTREIHKHLYHLLGSLSGNSEVYSIVDVSDWSNTKQIKLKELRKLYKDLINLTL